MHEYLSPINSPLNHCLFNIINDEKSNFAFTFQAKYESFKLELKIPNDICY